MGRPNWIDFDYEENSFGFKIDIDKPHSSHENRVKAAFKRVHKEYSKWDSLLLVGNVGGTLGLMVGFSFVTCVTEIVNGANVLFAKLNRILRRRVDEKPFGRHGLAN